jgi:hypothetical protein
MKYSIDFKDHFSLLAGFDSKGRLVITRSIRPSYKGKTVIESNEKEYNSFKRKYEFA